MVITQYKYYLKRISNLLIILPMGAVVFISFLSTNAMKAEWINQLNMAESDLNIPAVTAVIDGYNAISYINDFFFGDYNILFLIIMLAVFGITLSSDGLSNVSDGFGNFIVVRTGFCKYFNKLIIAQILFMVTIIGIFLFLLISLTLILSPPDWDKDATSVVSIENGNAINYILMWALQSLQYIWYVVLSVIIANVSSFVISNKYIIRLVPLIIYFIPLLISSTIGNMSDFLGKVLHFFVADEFIAANYISRVTDASNSEIFWTFSVIPFMLLVVFGIMYLCAKSFYKKRYI